MKKVILATTVLTSLLFATDLKTFESGTPATAADVNANFALLEQRITQLEQGILPVGSVTASMLDTTQFPGYGSTWVLADGRAATSEYTVLTSKTTVPDLRGVFLRGLDLGSGRDEDGSGRVAGDYQLDEFKRHTHSETQLKSGLRIQSGSDTYKGAQGVSTLQSGAAGGSETRPENVAVYYYIKVK